MSETAILVIAELKRDALGRVELLSGEQQTVRRVAAGGRIPGSGWIARRLMAREKRALQRLEGLPGVAQLVRRNDLSGLASLDGSIPAAKHVLLRSWLAGGPLHEAQALPTDFFERLGDLVQALHRRGVCHNDLHKEPNILVTESGAPALVDFQLASCHSRRRRSFRQRAAEDLRHVAKHRARYFLHCGSPDGEARPEVPAPSSTARWWRRLAKPIYNKITRRVLKVRDAEGRRPRGGPWPEWGAPLGPCPDWSEESA